jgi:anti-sigma-K factor RskA
MFTMKRYQNPDVYERLALEYSLGIMHGHARKRFESLMQQHPFLQIVVDEYNYKFAELATYLPEEKPSDQVWKNIEAQLDTEEVMSRQSESVAARESGKESHWRHIFTVKSFVAGVASFVLLISLVFVNVTQNLPAYSCSLAGQNKEVMFTALASKESMKLHVSPTGKIEVPEGKQMYFWCVPKNPTEPIMGLGALAKTGLEMKLTPTNWKGIEGAHMFGISFEVKGSKVTKPTDGLIYKGNIEPSKHT